MTARRTAPGTRSIQRPLAPVHSRRVSDTAELPSACVSLPGALDIAPWRPVLDALSRPEWPYAQPDPWGLHDPLKCMNIGPVLVDGSGSPGHVPLPCFQFPCDMCGPRRAALIRSDMATHLGPHESVWAYALRAPLGRRAAQVVKKPTEKLRERARYLGVECKYLWLSLDVGAEPLYVVLSTVDHSTRRKDGRTCVALDRYDAKALLDFTLWHGLSQRASSRGWPLSDSERATRGTSERIRVGMLGARKSELVLPTSRELYAADQRAARRRGSLLPDWHGCYGAPPGYTQSEAAQLHSRAVRKLKTPPLPPGRPGPFD